MKKLISFFSKLLFLITTFVYADIATITTTHFVIEYQNTSTHTDYATPDYINNVATIAEEIWNYVIINQGFKRPPAVPENPINDAQRVKIIVHNRSIGEYGATTIVGKGSLARQQFT